MTDAWERTCPFVELDSARLAELLRPVWGTCRVEQATLLTAGKCNTNYRVRGAGRDEPVVVRLVTREPAAAEREARLWALLRDRVPLAEVLHVGQTPEGWGCTVTTWVEGLPLATWLPTAGAAAAGVGRQLGAALASIGAVEFPSGGFFAPDLSLAVPLADIVEAYHGELRRCLFEGRAAARLGEALRDRVWCHAERLRPLLAPVVGAAQLVHGDYGPWNLLVRETAAGWRLVAVLDWEFALSGASLADLGNLLRWPELAPPAYVEAVAAGYHEAGGMLPADWLTISRVLDLTCLAQFLDSEEPRPRRHDDARHLLQLRVGEWDSQLGYNSD